jgi:O-antigen/teichoic acid export membrane protein
MDALRRPAGQSVLLLAARLAGAGLVFATQAAIARAWGPAALGEYLLIMAAVNLIAFTMPLGFNVIGSYFAAHYAAIRNRRRLSFFLLRAWRNVAVTALAFVLAWPMLSGVPGETIAVVRDVWLPLTILATATAIVFVNGAVLVGLGFPLAGFAADVVFRPLVMMAGFVAVLACSGPTPNVEGLIRLIAAGFACVALVHTGIAVVAVRRIPDAAEEGSDESRRWWRFAPPWIVYALATDFYFDIDLVLLSYLMNREDLAVFGVCARIFALVSFGIGAIYSIATPVIVAAEAERDAEGLARRLGDANLLAAIFGAAACLGSLLAGPFLLRLFGEAFVAGAQPLALMCLGLTLRAAMGPASLVLSIHDRPYAGLPATALGLAALVFANALLVPRFGLTGAGIAAVVSMTVWSAALWLTALRCTRLDVSIFPLMRRAFRS